MRFCAANAERERERIKRREKLFAEKASVVRALMRLSFEHVMFAFRNFNFLIDNR